MHSPFDAIIEVFTWVGFGAAVLLGIVAVVLWAADGTWLQAEAIVDRDGDDVVVRWFDGDGDANSAPLTAMDAAALGRADTATIWYRHGWHGRARLTRRPPGLRAVTVGALAMLALGVVGLVTGWVMLFVNG